MIESYQIDNLRKKDYPISIALGNFDGIHLGHAKVIETAVDAAKKNQGEAWIITFDPHPRKVLNPKTAPPLLNTKDQQKRFFDLLGIDQVVIQKFDDVFMKLSPESFFFMIKEKIPSLTSISVGENWSFGKNRLGNVKLLKKLCLENNINFNAQDSVNLDNQRISSSRIRKSIQAGKIMEANQMLLYPFSIVGTVVHGEKIGRKLGYNTANIDPENECLPSSGIYASKMSFEGNIYNAATYIGKRKTIHSDKPVVIETHLLEEKNINLYAKKVEVTFFEKIRDDQNLKNLKNLKNQIKIDIENVKKTLKKYSKK